MNKRRSHSKIDKLPLSIRYEVERQLVKGVTYAKIAEYLKSLGYDIHLTSVQRYGKPFLKRFEAMKKAIEQANFILND